MRQPPCPTPPPHAFHNPYAVYIVYRMYFSVIFGNSSSPFSLFFSIFFLAFFVFLSPYFWHFISCVSSFSGICRGCPPHAAIVQANPSPPALPTNQSLRSPRLAALLLVVRCEVERADAGRRTKERGGRRQGAGGRWSTEGRPQMPLRVRVCMWRGA